MAPPPRREGEEEVNFECAKVRGGAYKNYPTGNLASNTEIDDAFFVGRKYPLMMAILIGVGGKRRNARCCEKKNRIDRDQKLVQFIMAGKRHFCPQHLFPKINA